MKSIFLTTLLVATSVAADDTNQSDPDPNAWRENLPDEVSKKLPNDMSDLLVELGYDSRPKEQSPLSRPQVNVWGNSLSNFDNDDTHDWVIHVKTTDFRGRPISGTLIYDRTEHSWTLIAKLPGTFPISWGEAFEGRLGIRTLESLPDDSPHTKIERYYRWDGNRYIPDRFEFARGG